MSDIVEWIEEWRFMIFDIEKYGALLLESMAFHDDEVWMMASVSEDQVGF